MNLKTLITISRPRFWLYSAGTFAVGYVGATSNPAALLSPGFIGMLVYFLIPANLFLYGINDYADADTDRYSTKKETKEHILKKREREQLKISLLTISIITFIIAVLHENKLAATVLLAYHALCFAYSSPPFRFKAMPIIDSASNMLYILPGIYGYTLLQGSMPSWKILLAAAIWSSSMHLYSAIPDIKADTKADLMTTAVLLGRPRSIIICMILWTNVFSITLTIDPIAGILSCIYPLMGALTYFKKDNITRLYWWFPYLNAVIGMVLFNLIAVKVWY